MRAIVLAGLQQLANDGGEIIQVAAEQGFLEVLSLSRKTNCIRILTLNELVVLHWEAKIAHKKLISCLQRSINTIGHRRLQIPFIFPQNPIKTKQNWSQTHSHSELRPNKSVTVRFFWTWQCTQTELSAVLWPNSPVFLLRVLMSTTAAWFFSVKCFSKIMLCFSLALSINTVWLPTHRTW